MALREPTRRVGGGLDVASQQLEGAVANVNRARADEQWVDASQQLEKWVALCRKHSQQYVATHTADSAHSSAAAAGAAPGNMLSAMFAAKRFGRLAGGGSGGDIGGDGEHSMGITQLRERTPLVQRLIEREGAAAEQLAFVAFVLKFNKKGKVQHRLLAVTDQAVYNLLVKADKCQRRIPLGHISMVTASEPTNQFVLHVPSEYDYHYSAPSRGYAPIEDMAGAGAPLDGIIRALKRAYASLEGRPQTQLPVRNMSNSAPLSALVKKKQKSVHGDDAYGAMNQDDDDDDD